MYVARPYLLQHKSSEWTLFGKVFLLLSFADWFSYLLKLSNNIEDCASECQVCLLG